MIYIVWDITLRWRHNERHGVSNHQLHDCLLNRLFWRRSKKTSKLRVTGLCEGNSPVTGEFPAQRASNAGNVFIWWRHHVEHTLHAYCTRKKDSKEAFQYVCIWIYCIARCHRLIFAYHHKRERNWSRHISVLPLGSTHYMHPKWYLVVNVSIAD